MITRRLFGAGVLGAPWLAAAAARAEGAAAPVVPHALEEFYGETDTYDAALSPDGARIAVLRTRLEPLGDSKNDKGEAADLMRELLGSPRPRGADGKEMARVAYVDLVDAANPERVQQTVRIGDYTVDAVEWGSADRLLVFVRMTSINPMAIILGSKAGSLTLAVRRVLSVTADGKGSVVLFNDPKMLSNVYDLATIVDYLPDDPLHVLMQAVDIRARAMALFRVNIETGEAVRSEIGRWNTVGWVTDRGAPVLRYDSNSKGTVQRVYARVTPAAPWKFVRRTRTNQEPEFFYVGPSGRPGVILAGARKDEEDTIAVRELNLATLEFGPPLHRRDGHDVVGSFVDEKGRLLGVKYMEDRVVYAFTDPAMEGHFRAINRYLGDERNVSFFDVDEFHTRFIAYVSGPRDPGQQVFYDKAAKRVVSLGSLRPNLSEARLGRSEAIRVKTRDGTVIPAYLTAPPGGRRGPLVVWPHGGPEIRDYQDYQRTVQIFAAQGWWVLQPNFRGSGGFGQAFVRAGRRRWADLMQEDVEDAVQHVLDLGKADPDRIAIGGASYGGYAALMGSIRRPDLYRATVAVCGPSDMPAMLRSVKDDEDSYYYWSQTIGDPVIDRGLLEAASPARRAAEIRSPVLLIHGVNDQIVPVEQSRMMAAALKAAGKPHELIEVPDFGHADWDDAKDQELMRRKIDFLRKAFA